MWIYPTHLGILIPRGLRPIAPCPPPLLRQRAVITILMSGFRELYYRSFCFSHALVLTVGSIAEMLVGCSEGQFAWHWSGS